MQQSHQGRGEVTLQVAADKAWVTIKRDRLWPSVQPQGLHDCLERGFGSEILVHLGVLEDRGAGIDRVEDFHDVWKRE